MAKKLRANKKLISFETLDNEDTFDSSVENEDIHTEHIQQNWIERLFENITGHCVVLIRAY